MYLNCTLNHEKIFTELNNILDFYRIKKLNNSLYEFIVHIVNLYKGQNYSLKIDNGIILYREDSSFKVALNQESIEFELKNLDGKHEILITLYIKDDKLYEISEFHKLEGNSTFINKSIITEYSNDEFISKKYREEKKFYIQKDTYLSVIKETINDRDTDVRYYLGNEKNNSSIESITSNEFVKTLALNTNYKFEE